MHLLWFLRLLRLPVPRKTNGFYNISASQQVDWQSQSIYFAKPCRSTATLVCSVTELRAFPNATPWQRDRRSSKASRAGLLEFTETSYWIFPFRDEILLKRRKMVGQTVEVTNGESNVSLRRQRQVSLWLGDWRRMERGGKGLNKGKRLFCQLTLPYIAVTELLWAFVRSMRFIQTHTGCQT